MTLSIYISITCILFIKIHTFISLYHWMYRALKQAFPLMIKVISTTFSASIWTTAFQAIHRAQYQVETQVTNPPFSLALRVSVAHNYYVDIWSCVAQLVLPYKGSAVHHFQGTTISVIECIAESRNCLNWWCLMHSPNDCLYELSLGPDIESKNRKSDHNTRVSWQLAKGQCSSLHFFEHANHWLSLVSHFTFIHSNHSPIFQVEGGGQTLLVELEV